MYPAPFIRHPHLCDVGRRGEKIARGSGRVSRKWDRTTTMSYGTVNKRIYWNWLEMQLKEERERERERKSVCELERQSEMIYRWWWNMGFQMRFPPSFAWHVIESHRKFLWRITKKISRKIIWGKNHANFLFPFFNLLAQRTAHRERREKISEG